MRVLVTGHRGYIGSLLTEQLLDRGHDVVGLDIGLFEACTVGPDVRRVATVDRDVRDVTAADLDGVDAVCHLAGISNDPMGDLRPAVTDAVNHVASVALGRAARAAGVRRFVFSSSCSIYGAAPTGWVDEDAPVNPVTPYGWSKIRAEQGLSALATDDFSPVHLRNATVYGMSPRLRADLVVNNLVGHAVRTGQVLVRSDGTPWRPLVHVADVASAFVAALEAPRARVHDRVLNVGSTAQNHQVREIADRVAAGVPGATVTIAAGAGPDARDYRVDCDRIADVLGWRPRHDLGTAIAVLRDAFVEQVPAGDFEDRLLRLRHLGRLQTAGDVDEDFRWRVPAPSVVKRG